MLHLSAGDIAALERANTVLLSPFAFGDPMAWRRTACRAVEACVGGDGSSYALPMAGEPLIAASPEIERALGTLFPPPAWIVEALTVRRRALSLTVADWEELFDINVVRRAPFYHDVVRPHGLMAPLTMLADTGHGPLPAAVSVYFSDEGAARSRAHRRKQLLRLLFPAFRAGLETFLCFRRNAAALTALADDAAIGVLVFDPVGQHARENDYLQELMSREPERDRVRAEMRRAIRGSAHLRACSDLASSHPQAHIDVRTGAARYRVSATFLSDHGRLGSPLTIALVERLDPVHPSGQELGAQFSLTPREIEVAMLLPRGLSSREIATALGISLNTARRHVERLLLKLNVRNRTAAAAKISGR
jgi:DNA-binding CsgD family transcriptional regulator